MTTAINYRLCVIYFPKLDERNYGSYRFEISSKIRSTRSENGESKMLEEENETEWTIISRLKEEERFLIPTWRKINAPTPYCRPRSRITTSWQKNSQFFYRSRIRV